MASHVISPSPLIESRKVFRSSVQRSADACRHYAITIERPVQEVFEFLVDLTNVPIFIGTIKAASLYSDSVSEWVFQLESGKSVQLIVESLAQPMPQLITWFEKDGSDEEIIAQISVEPGPIGRGAVVNLSLPEAVLKSRHGEWARIFFECGEGTMVTPTPFRKLKALLETGECPTIDGQPTGRLNH